MTRILRLVLFVALGGLLRAFGRRGGMLAAAFLAGLVAFGPVAQALVQDEGAERVLVLIEPRTAEALASDRAVPLPALPDLGTDAALPALPRLTVPPVASGKVLWRVVTRPSGFAPLARPHPRGPPELIVAPV